MIIRERNLELKLNVKFLIWMKYQKGFQTSFAVRIRGLGLDISNMFHHFNYSLTLSFFLFNRFLVYFNNYISIVCVQIFVKYILWSWLRFLVEKNFTIWDSLLKIWYGTNKSEPFFSYASSSTLYPRQRVIKWVIVSECNLLA